MDGTLAFDSRLVQINRQNRFHLLLENVRQLSWFAGICTAIIHLHYGLLLLIRWHLYCHYSLALWLASPNSLAFDKATGIDRWHYGLLLLFRWHLICNCYYLLALWLPSPGSLAFDKATTIFRWHHGLLLLIRWHLIRQLPWFTGIMAWFSWFAGICEDNCHYLLASWLASPGSLAFYM